MSFQLRFGPDSNGLFIPNPKITWVGPGRQFGEFCLGTEDGELLEYDLQGRLLRTMPNASFESGPINGVVFQKNHFVVSSPDGNVMWNARGDSGKASKQGSHGVISGLNDDYYLPCGLSNFGHYREVNGEYKLAHHVDAVKPIYIYRFCMMTHSSQISLLTAALRTSGLGVINFTDAGLQISYYRETGLDCIDVVVFDSSERDDTLAVLDRNGSVSIATLSADQELRALGQISLHGEPFYQLQSWSEMLVVLGSDSLQLIDLSLLSARLRDGHVVGYYRFPVEASEINIIDNRWLAVVVDEGVQFLDLPTLKSQLTMAESYELQIPPEMTFTRVTSSQEPVLAP
ncbi:MAG: hypothetical protein ACRC8S_18390 [Fimbriiglobus sp.]